MFEFAPFAADFNTTVRLPYAGRMASVPKAVKKPSRHNKAFIGLAADTRTLPAATILEVRAFHLFILTKSARSLAA